VLVCAKHAQPAPIFNRYSAMLNPLQNNENSYFDLVQNDIKAERFLGLSIGDESRKEFTL
jgi:hypothetical protein